MPLLAVFLIDGQRYALRVQAVERVLPMVAVSSLPKAPAIALGVINLHAAVIPVLDIRRRFALPQREYGIRSYLLLARTRRLTVALPVDEVVGVREVEAETITSPEAVLPGIGHVAGIVALPDGLLLIHDLDTFLSLDEEQQVAAALGEIKG